MTARPILFSGHMVRALLEGRKTQTRRVVKPSVKGCTVGAYTGCKSGTEPVNVQEDGDPWTDIPCPYGKPGDLLWVRETWHEREGLIWYLADYPDDQGYWRWRPSIHMRRATSRLTLRIQAVRAERLNDISETDAKAEGYEPELFNFGEGRGFDTVPAREVFLDGEWAKPLRASNPWVWVIEFEVIKANVDLVLKGAA